MSRAKQARSNSAGERAQDALARLKRIATKKTRDGMARYGIPSENALGVPVGRIMALGKRLGRSQELSEALWATAVYEARMLAVFVGEPELVTAAQMDRWAKDFDSWAICDTACFHLFDRTPHAFRKVAAWARRRDEFVKRGAFALLACLALHDRQAEDDMFLRCLPLVEAAASDERNFVKKGVSWALRSIGCRSAALHAASLELAHRLGASASDAARWVGRDTARDLERPLVARRIKARERVKK